MDRTFILNGILFEWDAAKAATNQRKHGISFPTACEVFFDPFLTILGSEWRGGEQRQRVIGLTEQWQLLLVVVVSRRDRLHLISARAVTVAERTRYEDG